MSVQDVAEELIGKLYNEGQANVEAVNSGTAVTVSDPSLFSTSVVTLNGATPAITLPQPRAGAIKRLYLVQDATGSRIPSYVVPGGAMKWAGGAAPTLSTAAGKVDRVTLESFDGVNWYGTATLNFA
jgi:hypothetical protein